MQTLQGNMLQSLITVDAFLEENAARLAGVVSTGARQRLKAAIAALATHVSDQTGNDLASQGATKSGRSHRQTLLRDHMAAIARIARADLPQTPEIEPLRMPRGEPSVRRLGGLAEGMAKAAAPHSDVFIAAGLPKDFIARLNATADEMVQTLNDRAQSRGKRSRATAGLKAKLTEGRKIVHVLDAFVKTAFKGDRALLAGWNTVKRVQRVGVRPRTVVPAPTPTPTPAPSPAPKTPPTLTAI